MDLVVNSVTAEEVVAQVNATLRTVQVVLDETVTLGNLAVKDAFEARALGSTRIDGTASVGGALSVEGESLVVAGNVWANGDLVTAGTSYALQNTEACGLLRAHAGLEVSGAVLQARAQEVIVRAPKIIEAVGSGGKISLGNDVRVGRANVTGPSSFFGGVTASIANVTGATTSNVLSTNVLSVSGPALLQAGLKVDGVRPLDVRSNAQFSGTDTHVASGTVRVDGSGLEINAPIQVRNEMVQLGGAARFLGTSATLPHTTLPRGASLVIENGPLSVGGNAAVGASLSVGRTFAAGGACSFQNTTQTSGGAALFSAALSQTRVSPASLGALDASSMVVREGGDLQVSHGRTFLCGDVAIGGNVLMHGDNLEAHFNHYNYLGPNSDRAQDWTVRADDTVWRGQTWTGNVDEVAWNGNNWTSNFSRDVRWTAGRDVEWESGRDTTWTVGRNADWNVQGQVTWAADSWTSTVTNQTQWNTETFQINYNGAEGLVVQNDGGGADGIVLKDADKIAITNGVDQVTGLYVGGDRVVTIRQPPINHELWTPILPPLPPTPVKIAQFTLDINTTFLSHTWTLNNIIDCLRAHGLIEPSFP